MQKISSYEKKLLVALLALALILLSANLCLEYKDRINLRVISETSAKAQS